MTFRLAVQESACEGDTLVEKFAFARSVGFDGIELGARDNGVFGSRGDELRAARDAGVVMPTAVVHVQHFIGDFDPQKRREAIDELKTMLTVFGAAGGTGIVTPHAYGIFTTRLPPFTPPRSVEASSHLLLEALRALAGHAAGVGVCVYLEPLNRFEDFVVNTLEDACSYVDEIASPHLAVVADTWHMNIEEADIGAAIRRAGSRIRHVQLGDSNRLEPGKGHYNWDETLDALEGIGYDGWLATECEMSGPPRDVLPQVARLLKR